MAAQLCQESTIKSTTPLERFKLASKTVTDNKTGLMWQRCFSGASGENCTEGQAMTLSWAKAMQSTEALNQSGGFASFQDWRMPNIRELQTIAELQCVEPALNPLLFPSAPSGRTWSSSPYRFYPHYSWFVDFSFFEVNYLERNKPYFLLLVRSVGE